MIYLPLNIQRFASGTIDSPGTKVSGGDYMYYRINWSSGSNGSSANTSNVYVDLYARKGKYTTSGTWTGLINLDGSESSYSKYASIGKDWVHLHSYSKVVSHNSDGSKDCWIGAIVNGPSGTSAGGYSINYGESKTLDKIPRYGTANQSLASRTETSITMNWSSDNTVDYIWYSIDNGSNWTGINVTDGTSGSYTIYNLTAKTTYNIKTRIRRKDSQLTTDSSNLPVTTLSYPYIESVNDITVGDKLTIKLYNPLKRTVYVSFVDIEEFPDVETTGTEVSGYNDEFSRDVFYKYCGQFIPQQTQVVLVDTNGYNLNNKFFNININEEANNGEVKPTFNDFEIQDSNSKTLSLTNNPSTLILNYSIPKGVISTANKAIANKYGEMSKYKMIVGEQEPVETAYNTGTVELVALQPLTTKEITMYAIDNRGFSKGVTKNATLIDYTIPTLNLLEAKLTRSNNNVGDQVTLSFDGTYWNKNFGAKENSITKLTYRFKKTDSSEWSEEFDILENIEYNENVFRYEHLISGDLDNYGFDISESYDIIVYYQDELYGSSFNLILNSSTPNIAIAKTGNAMMMPYDEELGGALQVAGDIVVVGGKVVQPGGGGEIVGDTLPIGSQIPFAGTIVPDGWLLCDGRAISRTEYVDLFRAIGTSYGAGDGSTTFNLPNKKGKVSVGLDTNDADFNTIGKTGGEKTHVLSVYEMPQHNHAQYLDGNDSNPAGGGAAYDWMISNRRYGYTGGDLAAYSGGNQPHNILQPYQVDNWIIKAFQSAGVVAQVNNSKSDSKLDTYSCNFINGTVLYENTNGTNGNITLSETSANFRYLEVFYQISGWGTKSTRIESGKGIQLEIMSFDTGDWSNVGYIQNIKVLNVLGVNLSNHIHRRIFFYSNYTKPLEDDKNDIYITKVIGYK